jgi:RNA polymerase sigma-70 factor (ECF subfamily)
MPAEQPPDDQLLSRIAAGDADAFALLFGRRQKDVYRFALHMTASPSVAEDVTQEVFLAVMRDAGRYDPARATVVSWLCGIARNHVLRRLERDRQLEALEDGPPGLERDIVATGHDTLGDLTRAERIEELRQAILTLPVRYREAIVLCDLQELSYADAAAVLGCAIGTVRSRLHRGRTLLATKLATTTSSVESTDGAERVKHTIVSDFRRSIRSARTLA